ETNASPARTAARGPKDLQAFHWREIRARRKRAGPSRADRKWRGARQFLSGVEKGFSGRGRGRAWGVSELVEAERLFARPDFISRRRNAGVASKRVTKRAGARQWRRQV